MVLILLDEQMFIPSAEIADAAAKGLSLKEQFKRGGTSVGWVMAAALKNREPINASTIKRITSYFARHEVDKKAKNFGNDDNPSKGYIAWLLWGGDQSRKWAEEIKRTLS